MKIVVATPYYPPHIGGVERYCREICVGLVRRHGWRVVVATSAMGGDVGVFEENGVVVHRMPVQAMFSATPLSLSWYRQVRRLIGAESPDVVVGHSPVPFMADVAALASRSRPFVLTYHSGPLAKGRLAFDAVATLYEQVALRSLLRRSAAVIHCSSDSARFSERLVRRESHIVTPGVDLRLFFPDGESPAVPTVVYVGRLERSSPWKGVRDLLDAVPLVIRDVPDLRVELVGGGDDVPRLQDYVRAKHLEGVVTFRGALSGETLAQRYREASVVVLPSTTSSESFPLVLLEAAACGRPVVATRVGSVASIVRDGETGFLVDPGNPRALASNIAAVLSDKDLASSLGRAAAERARREFSWESRIDATGEVLEGVAR